MQLLFWQLPQIKQTPKRAYRILWPYRILLGYLHEKNPFSRTMCCEKKKKKKRYSCASYHKSVSWLLNTYKDLILESCNKISLRYIMPLSINWLCHLQVGIIALWIYLWGVLTGLFLLLSRLELLWTINSLQLLEWPLFPLPAIEYHSLSDSINIVAAVVPMRSGASPCSCRIHLKYHYDYHPPALTLFLKNGCFEPQNHRLKFVH